MLVFSVPVNDLIGPAAAAALFGAAVTVAIIMGFYRVYLTRQEAGWAKPSSQQQR